MALTNIYICADSTLTYGPSGGTDKVVPQALPIAVVEDEAEALDLISILGKKAYDVPETDAHFEKQLAGRTIKPGYGPTYRYFYALPDFRRDDTSTLPAVSAKAVAMLALIRSHRA